MKKCIKMAKSRRMENTSAKDGTSLNTGAALYTKDDIEWWFNEENSYDAGLNLIDGNWYYYLFKRMSGIGRR